MTWKCCLEMSSTGGQEIELFVFSNDEETKANQETTNKTELTQSQHIAPVSNDEVTHSLDVDHVKREEIAEPLSLAGVQELRGVLSEAINTSLFKFAVTIVFVFNFSYSLFNSFRQDGTQEESNDSITDRCHCNGRHRTFYVTIVLMSTVVWFLILVLEKFYTRFVQPGRYGHCLLELIIDNSKFDSYFTKELNLLLSAVYDDQNNMDMLIAKLKKQQSNNDNDDTGTIPSFGIPHYLKHSFPNAMLATSGEGYCKKSVFSSAKDNVFRRYRHFCRLKRRHKAIASFKLFLIVNQFLAQLLIVPLLELQWLDQYAWVCVAGVSRNYCNSEEDVYNLALDQAVVVYMFYASILFAALLSIVINWLPQYYDKQA